MELIRPNRKYRMSYLEAANEYEENCIKTYHFMEEGSGDMFERFEELETGSYMLAQGLEYARRNLPLKRVLLTCNDDNMASARVIEKNGGILQDKIENVTNERKWITRRYWIEL